VTNKKRFDNFGSRNPAIPQADKKERADKDPSWEDMLIAYATVPGYVANRYDNALIVSIRLPGYSTSLTGMAQCFIGYNPCRAFTGMVHCLIDYYYYLQNH
jgi:hypothetical protein